MTEGWVNIDGTQAAIRLLLTQVSAMRGVGLGRLQFVFEATSRHPAMADMAIWLGGTLNITEPATAGNHVATLTAGRQPLILPDPGEYRQVVFAADIGYPQLQAIEEARTAGVKFSLDLDGYRMLEGTAAPCTVGYLEHQIGQSDWLNLLDNVGYRRVLLFELDRPDARRTPALSAAVTYFDQAQSTTSRESGEIPSSLCGRAWRRPSGRARMTRRRTPRSKPRSRISARSQTR